MYSDDNLDKFWKDLQLGSLLDWIFPQTIDYKPVVHFLFAGNNLY